ncbi:RelB/DinJ family addiction module antitoxin [Adlercreutzia sp. R25]|uniref:RelB/DinJ family addiction module antitoxin n=1 Tax=Adlercreutzia shanghongiae TaxID=3111773 RepID=A0ABU6J040_9ACTN|nr:MULTISPECIES: RelB/DinJ family addiction module antitoxin [unclassified Adlercreutzia]MEC4273235.1 RelB/DinJ family addiction module antitoxin [Adlercreutzia sp. R25]MEC4295472.1 RelB/DinJ family addiction module antitoxin [Adlercreutzia sp. R22]
MADVMVTGRMPERKKQQGLRVLKRRGMNASQAVNLLFDRLIEEGNADFLLQDDDVSADERWASAARFVDSLPRKRVTRFGTMTKAEIKLDRLAAKGLV